MMSGRELLVRNGRAGFGVVLLSGLLTACGPANNDGSGSSPQEGQNALPAGSSAPATTEPYAFSSFDVCAHVSAADVAVILESDPAQTTGKPTMGRFASDCTYTAEREAGGKDYVIVEVYSEEMWAPSETEVMERIPGLGDDAYLAKGFMGGSFEQVHVLLKGRMGVDARAGSRDRAQRLARLAVAKLSGSSS